MAVTDIFGNDKFVNNEFDWLIWSAPVIQEPDELRDYIKKLRITGKKIVGMKSVGMFYSQRIDDIEGDAYTYFKHFPDDIRYEKSRFDNIPPDFLFLRYAEVGEPLMIQFENGDHMEIEYSNMSEVRVSINRIPWDIQPGVNHRNFDANILFSICLGKAIQEVEVVSMNRDEFIESKSSLGLHGYDWQKQTKFIKKLILRLDDGIQMCFEPWYDYGEIFLLGRDNEDINISFSELKTGFLKYQ